MNQHNSIRYASYVQTRRYALEVARDKGFVLSADLVRKWPLMPTTTAAWQLLQLRDAGYLEADDVLRGKAITNRLTQEGRDYLDSGMREGMPRFDATALVAAMGAQ